MALFVCLCILYYHREEELFNVALCHFLLLVLG